MHADARGYIQSIRKGPSLSRGDRRRLEASRRQPGYLYIQLSQVFRGSPFRPQCSLLLLLQSSVLTHRNNSITLEISSITQAPAALYVSVIGSTLCPQKVTPKHKSSYICERNLSKLIIPLISLASSSLELISELLTELAK